MSPPAAATFIAISANVVAGNNRILIATIATNVVATTAFFEGIPLTRIVVQSVSGGGEASIWYLLDPPIVTGGTFAAYFNATGTHCAGVSIYTGVDSRTPFGTAMGAQGTSTTASVTVGTASGELIVDVACLATSSATLTQVADQTERWNDTLGGVGGVRGAASTQLGSAGGVMSWTVGSSQNWAIAAVSLKPPTTPYYYWADASATYLSATAGGAIWKLRYDPDAGPTEVGALAASTATAGSTSTTLEDSTAPFGGASAYVNSIVKLTGGTGAGQYRRIASHTSTQLTVSAWATTPSTDTTYQVLASLWVSGANFGRPSYYYSKTYVPCGASANVRRLDAIAAPLALDTWADSGFVALHSSTFQKTDTPTFAGAKTANQIGTASAAPTSALTSLGSGVGDTSTTITDLIETQGYLFVAKEDGLYEFDSDGVARPVGLGLSRSNPDNENGRGSASFGDMILYPCSAGMIRYQIGSGSRPIGLEEITGFRRTANTGIVSAKDRRPVGVIRSGKYLYTTYNSDTKSLICQFRLRETVDPAGPEWVWNSLRDVSLVKGLGRDSDNRLWLKGADPDSGLRAFQVMELDPHGGTDTQFRRGAVSETYTIIFGEWTPNDGEQVQDRTFELETSGGWSAQTSLQPQVYRDDRNGAESIGSAITIGGTTINNWNVGSAAFSSAVTLSEDLDATETGVDVNDATPISARDIILVDSEKMSVTSKSSNTLTVVRGVENTAAATHSTSAAVTNAHNDTEYRSFTVLKVTTGATYTPLASDPMVMRVRRKGRTPMFYRCVVPANDAELSRYGLTAEDARQRLFRFQNQGVIAFNEPGPSGPRSDSFNAEVVSVQDTRYETATGIGYGIQLTLRRHQVD